MENRPEIFRRIRIQVDLLDAQLQDLWNLVESDPDCHRLFFKLQRDRDFLKRFLKETPAPVPKEPQ